MEFKHRQFQKYLEKSGVDDAINKVLYKLYVELNKPEDVIYYIWKNICTDCPNKEKLEKLKQRQNEAEILLKQLEIDLYRLRGNLKLTKKEMNTEIEKYYEKSQNNKQCKSLLKKYLTKELIKKFKNLQTSNGATIWHNIQAGLKNHELIFGFYAADVESYNLYYDLFDPIICDYFLQSKESLSLPLLNSNSISTSKSSEISNWNNLDNFVNFDINHKDYVTSIRITAFRNLKEYPFSSVMTENDFLNVETKIENILTLMNNEFKGNYFSIINLERKTYNEMIKSKLAFTHDNKYLDDAENYRFWPIGRGIFYTLEKDLIIWINSEDHIKIISHNQDGNLNEVCERIANIMKFFENNLNFAYNERYGYLTFSPENLGIAMNITIQMKLSNLMKSKIEFYNLINKFNNLKLINKSQMNGNNNSGNENTIEITTTSTLTLNENEFIKEFQNSIQEILEIEKKFSNDKNENNFHRKFVPCDDDDDNDNE